MFTRKSHTGAPVGRCADAYYDAPPAGAATETASTVTQAPATPDQAALGVKITEARMQHRLHMNTHTDIDQRLIALEAEKVKLEADKAGAEIGMQKARADLVMLEEMVRAPAPKPVVVDSLQRQQDAA